MTPKHIAIVNRSTKAHPDQVILWADAANLQIQRDVAPLWDGNPPGVFVYPDRAPLPDSACVVALVDDDGDPEALGFHSEVGDRPFGVIDMTQSDRPWETLGHEVIELYGDARLDRTFTSLVDSNTRLVGELCDPTQGRRYDITVEKFGLRAVLSMPDFVLPAWFTGDPGPTTFCEKLGLLPRLDPNEIAPGGYQIALDRDGGVHYLGEKVAPEVIVTKDEDGNEKREERPVNLAAARVREKLERRPSSRTAQLLSRLGNAASGR